MGPQHGFGLARRILHVSEGAPRLESGHAVSRALRWSSDDEDHVAVNELKVASRRAPTLRVRLPFINRRLLTF